MDLASTISKKDVKLSRKYSSEVPNEVIEEKTKKIPNLLFLSLAGLSIVGSAVLTFATKRKSFGNFVGLWVPTLLILGVYNKIVKVEDELLESATKH